MSSSAKIIAEISAERQRQRDKEGWSDAHDDEHTDCSLAIIAACYALPEASRGYIVLRRREERDVALRGECPIMRTVTVRYKVPQLWSASWHPSWWKPKDRRRDLVRAGALIVAEIERLDRKAGQVRDERPSNDQRGVGNTGAGTAGEQHAHEPGSPDLTHHSASNVDERLAGGRTAGVAPCFPTTTMPSECPTPDVIAQALTLADGYCCDLLRNEAGHDGWCALDREPEGLHPELTYAAARGLIERDPIRANVFRFTDAGREWL